MQMLIFREYLSHYHNPCFMGTRKSNTTAWFHPWGRLIWLLKIKVQRDLMPDPNNCASCRATCCMARGGIIGSHTRFQAPWPSLASRKLGSLPSPCWKPQSAERCSQLLEVLKGFSILHSLGTGYMLNKRCNRNQPQSYYTYFCSQVTT